jgi:hypothetical protein
VQNLINSGPDLDEELRELFSENVLNAPNPQVISIFREAQQRGFLSVSHLRRTFASLAKSQALPKRIDERFARHLAMWIQVINQPYFKPVITQKGRLNSLIDVLSDLPYVEFHRKGLCIVDFGSGHPPYTTIDLAERFPEANVHGIDLYLPAYMIRRENGAYALFDSSQRLRAANANNIELLHEMVMRWDEVEQQFTNALNEALPLLHNSNGQVIVSDRSVVTRNPTQALKETSGISNLSFWVNDQGCFDLPILENESVDVLWSFNCLLHYDLAERMAGLRKLSSKVKLSGIVMEGYTSPSGSNAVYSVWQKQETRLVMREFGFSLSNLHHPLWPLRERDPHVEMMNQFINLIKSNVTVRQAVARESTAGCCLSRESIDSIVEHLNESGYVAQVKNDQFVVINCTECGAEIPLPMA